MATWAVWIAPSALFLVLVAWVQSCAHIEVPPALDDATRAAVISALAGALRDPEDKTDPTAAGVARGLHRPLAQRGPLVVSVLFEGRPQIRLMAYGDTLGQAVADASSQLVGEAQRIGLSPAIRTAARIKVDLVVARGPIVQSSSLIRALSVHPGLEGVAVTVEDERGDRAEAVLLPDEMFLYRLFGTYRPFDYIPEFTIGFDFERADMMLAGLARLPPGAYGSGRRSYTRVRTDSFVERPLSQRESGPPLPLRRGLPPPPPLTPESLRAGAIAGGRYLVAHLAPNGRYVYQRDLTTARATDPSVPGPYSIPRHAGTTYFLAELYRLTGEDFLREPIERAFAHLDELIRAGGCTGTLADGSPFACVIDLGQTITHLGSTALTVVALAEYQRATGDRRYEPMARALTAWILDMQRPDGTFHHVYDVASGRKDPEAQFFYYAGESALALARMHTITGEDRYRDAAERALDALVGWYDFFAGGFFYGEEHWTCIAAEAAYPAVDKARYRRFCNGYAAFLRWQQPLPGEFSDQIDYAGSYNVTPFMIPQNTPAGSRTESMISAYLLGRHQGHPEPAIRAQITLALEYALRQQLRADSDFSVSAKVDGIGAVPGTPVDRSVRIDFVQHVCSAMIRAAVLLEEEAAAGGGGGGT
ncbi:hypothetical protein [Haliangium sp.]|uniref:hypothetical protein n=1 Tax=Haliangium sp. TaxID=2663208 RepID=UPI003D10BC9E